MLDSGSLLGGLLTLGLVITQSRETVPLKIYGILLACCTGHLVHG
jgi:hypothetical protein